MSLTPAALETFVRRLAENAALWQDQVTRDPTARVYELIWEDADVNAWLICWSEDSDTGFHDHDHSAAAITVIDGALLEERMRLSGPPSAKVHRKGTTLTLPPTAIHRVLHAGTGPAVSIHAYSPPLVRSGAYRVADDGVLEREPQGRDAELRADALAAA